MNPMHEAALMAISTAVGIVLGTVAATLVLQRMQTKQLPASTNS